MRKAQFRGVEEVALQLWQRRFADAQLRSCSVECVANHGMLQRGKMDANLVRASGVKLDFDQRGVVDVCEDAPVGARFARICDGSSVPGFSCGGHSGAANGI